MSGLNVEEKIKIIELSENGFSTKQISRELNKDASIIFLYRKQLKL